MNFLNIFTMGTVGAVHCAVRHKKGLIDREFEIIEQIKTTQDLADYINSIDNGLISIPLMGQVVHANLSFVCMEYVRTRKGYSIKSDNPKLAQTCFTVELGEGSHALYQAIVDKIRSLGLKAMVSPESVLLELLEGESHD